MRKFGVFLLWIFLLLFVLASVYISFTSYLYDRDSKMLANVSSFFLQMQEKKNPIELPYPEYTILMYADKSGKFVSSNVGSPVDRDKYVHVSMPVGDHILYMYIREVDIGDYLRYVSNFPLYIGLLVTSLLLYMSIFYFTIREFEFAQSDSLTEELINRIKALRLTLATFKVAPEESIEEMKKVVDSIIKHRFSKR